MPTQISNTASLTFEYGSQTGFATSNLAITTLKETVSISKTSLDSSYNLNDTLTYIITVNNNGDSTIRNTTVCDNLGTYCIHQNPGILFTPLTYVGPAQLFIAGNFISNLEPTIYAQEIMFTIPAIPSNSNALIIYKVIVNDTAPLNVCSCITNAVTLSSSSLPQSVTACHTIHAAERADVRIFKSMAPNPILAGETITYSFHLCNYGNIEATNVVLEDQFTPAPSAISVAVNCETLSLTDYSYINGRLTIPGYGSTFNLTIPAAEFIQDITTGIVSIEPGIVFIKVTGQI